MNCPVCYSIMENKSEIHSLPNNKCRIELDCWNDNCPARKIDYVANMGVIMSPNLPWECSYYHLPFKFKNKWYAIVGNKILNYTDLFILHYRTRRIVTVDFISISTGDEMHVRATEVFNRLIKLVVFS